MPAPERTVWPGPERTEPIRRLFGGWSAASQTADPQNDKRLPHPPGWRYRPHLARDRDFRSHALAGVLLSIDLHRHRRARFARCEAALSYVTKDSVSVLSLITGLFSVSG